MRGTACAVTRWYSFACFAQGRSVRPQSLWRRGSACMHAPVISYMPHQRIKVMYVKHNCALHSVQPLQRRLAHLSG